MCVKTEQSIAVRHQRANHGINNYWAGIDDAFRCTRPSVEFRLTLVLIVAHIGLSEAFLSSNWLIWTRKIGDFPGKSI